MALTRFSSQDPKLATMKEQATSELSTWMVLSKQPTNSRTQIQTQANIKKALNKYSNAYNALVEEVRKIASEQKIESTAAETFIQTLGSQIRTEAAKKASHELTPQRLRER